MQKKQGKRGEKGTKKAKNTEKFKKVEACSIGRHRDFLILGTEEERVGVYPP